MEQKKNPRFEKLLEAARQENWAFVDDNMGPKNIAPEWVVWAVDQGLSDGDKNVRDLAATLLNRSDTELPPSQTEKVLEVMRNDQYHIVRFRLAIALYERGNQSPEVYDLVLEADNDPDVGVLAAAVLEKRPPIEKGKRPQ